MALGSEVLSLTNQQLDERIRAQQRRLGGDLFRTLDLQGIMVGPNAGVDGRPLWGPGSLEQPEGTSYFPDIAEPVRIHSPNETAGEPLPGSSVALEEPLDLVAAGEQILKEQVPATPEHAAGALAATQALEYVG